MRTRDPRLRDTECQEQRNRSRRDDYIRSLWMPHRACSQW